MSETVKQRGAPRGPRKPKDNIGLIAEASKLLRRTLDANMLAVAKFIQPEHVSRLADLRGELEDAVKAVNSALHGLKPALSQLEQTCAMQARIEELERLNAQMAERLSTAGHSDAIPPQVRRGGKANKQLSAEMAA